MIKFSVPEMMCNNCVARIEKAMAAEELKVTVSLAEKTVLLEGCEKCAARAKEVLEDLGFSAIRQ